MTQEMGKGTSIAIVGCFIVGCIAMLPVAIVVFTVIVAVLSTVLGV